MPELFEVIPAPAKIDDLPLPDKGPYIVAHQEGYSVHKSFFFGRVLVPTDKAPMAQKLEQPAFLWYDIPKLPASLVGEALSFFSMVFATRGSEAMVDIMWEPERGYSLFVPNQRASAGGVEAKRNPTHLRKGSRHVGTIHSHCDFSAFHSGTDEHDADNHDGLHITIGHVDDPTKTEFAVMIAASKHKWDFEIADVVDGPIPMDSKHPLWWHRYVDDPLPANKGKHISQWSRTAGWLNRGDDDDEKTWGQTSIGFPTKDNPVVVGPKRHNYAIKKGDNFTRWFMDLDSLADALEESPFVGLSGADVEALSYYINEVEVVLDEIGVDLDLRFKVDTRKLVSATDDSDEAVINSDDEEAIKRYYEEMGM